jgi:peptide/nickel transport system substrate-binding protein
VWATSAYSGLLLRVDPRSDEPVQTISVGNEPRSLAVAGGAVWVANMADDTVSRVDAETGAVRKIPIARPGALAADGRRLWVAQPDRGYIVAVDITGRQPPTMLRTGAPIASLAPVAGHLALATLPTIASHRGGTLRVAGGDDLDSLDPGEAWSSIGWQLLSLTNDGLLTYARLPGTAGATVVPDLAVSLPTVRDGGRVFTFRLRSGVRYSTGGPVRAQDIRTAIEREYAAGTGLAALGVPILGGNSCTHSRCDLARGVDVGTDERTITFRLAAPDASFLYKLALPFGAAVPAGTPAVGVADLKTLPATGPYRIASYVKGGEVVLVRNERFRVWSGEAQPAGFPDRIVVRLGLDPDQQAAAVSSGRADATLDTPPAATLSRIRARAPLQLHATAVPEVDAVFMNTAKAPFDEPAVREALALAVDRTKVVAIAGGPGVARVTCQIVPAGFPGYQPTCPYTAAPNAAGVWKGPDLARALGLVEHSGTSGTRVTVSTVANDPQKLAVGRYFVGLLRTLGYRAGLRLYPDRHAYYSQVGLARRRSQLGVFEWIADYEAGSTFFRPLFTCASYRPGGAVNLNAASFCHRTIDALIAHATSLEATNSVAANLEWSRVDREITARVPWIPLVNPVAIDYVSRRVNDYQRHPVFGLLLDRVSVR